jgi:hypothetical protein
LDHPTVRNSLVVFACGFFAICIIGPVICLGMWLIGLGAAALKLSTLPAILSVSVPVAARIIFQIAMAFGALLAALAMFESARRKWQKVRVPGHHPTLGDFEQLPYFKSWQAKPTLPTGHAVNLYGQGSRPSDMQTAIWQQFIARYESLSATASRSLLTPPHPLQECSSVTLTPNGITLAKNGHLHVVFQFTAAPDHHWTTEIEEPIPFAVFTPTLELEKTQWIAP